MEELYLTGTLAGAGSFRCRECGYAVALDSPHEIPECPVCGATTFERASLFGLDQAIEPDSMLHDDEEGSDWLPGVRSGVEYPGRYVAFRDEDRVSVVPLAGDWTRVGRSPSAEIQLDDPTVSRRHALIVCDGSRSSVLDDRSLNGVFVNGQRVEQVELQDGDEILVGRYRLHFLDTEGAIAETGSGASQALA